MLTQYLGEMAALLASFCFVIGPTMNTLATQWVSIGALNVSRLAITSLLIFLLHWILYGSFIPSGLQPQNWFWLGLSGLFTLALGDSLLFTAFSLIGTRLGMLIISLNPVISAILGWFILGEKLAPQQIIGISATIAGIAWVVSDRNGKAPASDRSSRRKGIRMALCSTFFFAFGSITAKLGLANGLPALSGHLLRTVISLFLLLLVMAIQGRLKTSFIELKTSSVVLKYVFVGAVFGPLLGNWLVLIALQTTDVGVVGALTALPPVILLPVAKYYFKEEIGWQAVCGSFVAVLGVLLLFLD